MHFRRSPEKMRSISVKVSGWDEWISLLETSRVGQAPVVCTDCMCWAEGSAGAVDEGAICLRGQLRQGSSGLLWAKNLDQGQEVNLDFSI